MKDSNAAREAVITAGDWEKKDRCPGNLLTPSRPRSEWRSLPRARSRKIPGATGLKVKKKIFFIIGGTDDRKSLTVKLPSSGRMALLMPFTSPTGYGLGKSGWVTSEFAPTDVVPVDRFFEWIEESYRAVAPKKLIAELDNPEAKPATTKPKKQSRSAEPRRTKRSP